MVLCERQDAGRYVLTGPAKHYFVKFSIEDRSFSTEHNNTGLLTGVTSGPTNPEWTHTQNAHALFADSKVS